MGKVVDSHHTRTDCDSISGVLSPSVLRPYFGLVADNNQLADIRLFGDEHIDGQIPVRGVETDFVVKKS